MGLTVVNSTFVIILNICAKFGLTDDKFENLLIFDMSETSDKFQFYSPKEYKRLEFINSTIGCFNKIIDPLTSLHNEVEVRLKQNHPEIYPVLSGALYIYQEDKGSL